MITTNALELGIDIGALDAAVCVTFPGTVASLRQMWGRAGRRGRGLAVYVAGEDALDQFFCKHPDEFLDRPVEAAILDHESEEIHLAHLLCAAHEAPIDPDARPGHARPARARCTPSTSPRAGTCVERRGAFVLRRPEDFPAARVALRSASPGPVPRGEHRFGGDARDGRVRARALHGPRRRGLPAPGALLRGARARPRRAPRARRAVHRRLVHAAQEGDRHLRREAARPPRDARGDAELRRGDGHRAGAGLPAQAASRATR